MAEYKPHRCPHCNEVARGTVEILTGCAEMTFDDDGTGEYDGDTDIWWEEQETVTAKSGRVKMVCRNGHDWWARKAGI